MRIRRGALVPSSPLPYSFQRVLQYKHGGCLSTFMAAMYMYYELEYRIFLTVSLGNKIVVPESCMKFDENLINLYGIIT